MAQKVNAEERWAPVRGFEGRYDVSTLGRVRSLLKRTTPLVLKPGVHDGYETVGLWAPGGVSSRHRVATLVLTTFVSARPPGMEALHGDGVRRNNRLSNLRWGTHAENMADRTAHGHNYWTNQESCIRGHPLSGVNLIPGTRPDYRQCRACRRAHNRNSLLKRTGRATLDIAKLADRYYRALIGLDEGEKTVGSKTTVYLVDDLDGSDAEETVEFGLDGVTYEVDLNDEHATDLRDELQAYIAVARRVSGRAKRGTAAKSPSTGYSREQNAEIRRWGRENGWEVSDRGRINGQLAEAWEKAHQGAAA